MINLILGSDVPASASSEVVVRRVLPRAPLEVLQLEGLLMTKQVKAQVLEPLPGPWWVEQSKANKASKQQAAQATAQQQQQQEAEAKATYQQGIDTFKRAFSACMDARGYSIK